MNWPTWYIWLLLVLGCAALVFAARGILYELTLTQEEQDEDIPKTQD